jgi:hypothetical protein
LSDFLQINKKPAKLKAKWVGPEVGLIYISIEDGNIPQEEP